MGEVVKGLVFIMTLLVALGAVTVGLICMSLLVYVLWPQRVREVRMALEERPSRAFWLGGANLATYLFVAVLVGHTKPGQLLILCLVVTVLVHVVVGLPGMFHLVGERIGHLGSSSGQSVRIMARGGAVVMGAGLVPWIGQALWIGLLIGVFGASWMVTVGWLRRPKGDGIMSETLT